MSEVKEMSESEKKKEDWMNSKWRPAMGWLYMGVCFFDFVAFPVLWSILQAVTKQPLTQWQPLTLQGAGLFHLAMGAVLGLAAWGRTQEKMSGANNGGLAMPSTGSSFSSSPAGGFGSTSPAPTSSFGGSSFGATAPSTSFGATAPSPGLTPGTAATPMAAKKPTVSRPVDDSPMPALD